jgi:hypothetical protein
MTTSPIWIFSVTRMQQYSEVVLAVILTAIVRLLLGPILGADLPLFLFMIPVVLASWSGGLWLGARHDSFIA